MSRHRRQQLIMKFSFNFSFSFVSRGVAGEVGDVDRGSSRFDDVSMLCNFFFIHIFFVYIYTFVRLMDCER